MAVQTDGLTSVFDFDLDGSSEVVNNEWSSEYRNSCAEIPKGSKNVSCNT